jgi:hypothetical protein
MRQQADIKSRIYKDRAYTAPVFSAAKILSVDEKQIISIFILLIVMVLEPLSVGLAVAASSAWMAGKNAGNAEKAANPAAAADEIRHFRPKRQKRQLQLNQQVAENGKTAKMAIPVKSDSYPELAEPEGGNGRNDKTAKTAIVINSEGYGRSAKTANPANDKLRVIRDRYNLSLSDIARIVGRSNIWTIERWLGDETTIPEKALRALNKWSRKEHQKSKVVSLQHH